MGPDSHRTEANLHVGKNLSLQPIHSDDGNGKSQKNKDDVDECPQQIARLARSGVRS